MSARAQTVADSFHTVAHRLGRWTEGRNESMIASLAVDGYSDVVAIGQGGLGDVYRARRISTGGLVAFKVLRSDGDVSTVRRRVEREVAALVQLKGHPYVVQIEEMISSSYGPIVVMEFAANGSLSDLVKEGRRLTVPECILVLEHVATALRDAHARGIIHRDIKPHNLLIGEFGQVKVCDFGIAAIARATALRDRTSALSFRYASPEELEERDDIGPPADVYSLGVTVRHLFTGSASRSSTPPEPDNWMTGIDPDDAAITLALWSLVRDMVSPMPKLRPQPAEILISCELIAQQLGQRRIRTMATQESLSDVLLQSLSASGNEIGRAHV